MHNHERCHYARSLVFGKLEVDTEICRKKSKQSCNRIIIVILHAIRITNQAKRMRINSKDNYLGSELIYSPHKKKQNRYSTKKKFISSASERADGGPWGRGEKTQETDEHSQHHKNNNLQLLTSSNKCILWHYMHMP